MIQSLADVHSPRDFSRGFDNTIDRIHLIYRYISQHFREDISLTSIANNLHYSVRQCQRILTDHMGVTFNELLTDFRLRWAQQLLETTGKSIEQVSEDAGFPNAKAFSSYFTKVYGMSPSAYRKLHHGDAPG